MQQHEMAKDYEEYVYLTVATQPFHASLVMPEVAKENPSAPSTQLDILIDKHCIKVSIIIRITIMTRNENKSSFMSFSHLDVHV